MESILESISSIHVTSLAIYCGAIVATIIIGRFVWVYAAVAYMPRMLFPSIRKAMPHLPWQYPFIISWAGMRGAISLAAAFAVPLLPLMSNGVNPRDLIVFLTFCVIAATFLIQGLTLPWLIKKIGMHVEGVKEKYDEHISELNARLQMTNAVLSWLSQCKINIGDDQKLKKEIEMYQHEYQLFKERLKERISDHEEGKTHDQKKESKSAMLISSEIIKIERAELFKLWREEKINHTVRKRLIERLDHQMQHVKE